MRRKLFNFLTSAAIVISLLSLTSCNKYNKVTQYEDTDDIMYNNTKYIHTEQVSWVCDRGSCPKSAGLGISRH